MRFLALILVPALALGVLQGCKPKVNNEDILSLPRVDYDKGGARFSLAKIEGFKEVHPDSVAWSSYMQPTAENGQITYLFLTGHEIELASPQVRVEYIAKSLPNCGSEKELHDWLKGMFLTPERQGQVIGGDPLSTLEGQEVQVLEIATPVQSIGDTLMRAGKRMAWAYVEAGDRFVAFNFTSTDSSEYFRGIPMFRQLVRSFRKSS